MTAPDAHQADLRDRIAANPAQLVDTMNELRRQQVQAVDRALLDLSISVVQSAFSTFTPDEIERLIVQREKDAPHGRAVLPSRKGQHGRRTHERLALLRDMLGQEPPPNREQMVKALNRLPGIVMTLRDLSNWIHALKGKEEG
jgi:hypothetical protein